jgi:probable rRNA maturation factor
MKKEMGKTLNIDIDVQDFENVYKSSIDLCRCAFIQFIESNDYISNIDQLSLSLLLVDDKEMQSINKEQRGKDKTTDVLSFPMQESIRDNKVDNVFDELHLGDIVVSKDTCLIQAKENDIDFIDEFIHLLAHGFLHLLGFDHELSESEDKLMRGLEADLIDEISKIKKGQ